MFRFFNKNKLEKATERQRKAFGIFTQAMEDLKTANAELEALMDDLIEQEVKIRQDKAKAVSMRASNKTVINNIEKMLGGVVNEG